MFEKTKRNGLLERVAGEMPRQASPYRFGLGRTQKVNQLLLKAKEP